MNIEIIVPVRPGDKDRFPVGQTDVTTRVIECPDGNLSKLYKEAYLTSEADIVIFKHDDLWIRNWDDYIFQVEHYLSTHLVIGIAGTRSYAPNRHPAWWMQTEKRNGHVDGLNRGIVCHPSHGIIDNKYIPVLYGEPGPAVVLDGCLIAVWRNHYGLDYYQPVYQDRAVQIAKCFDEAFTYHFYDVAFTLNFSQQDIEGYSKGCYVICSDIVHEGMGELTKDWQKAAERFTRKYSTGQPVSV